MDFIVNCEYKEDEKHWEIELSGEIDIFNSNDFKTRLLDVINEKPGDLYFNCRNLEYIDSTGLGALVAVLKHVKSYNGQIYLKQIRSNLAKLFRITNLDKVFIIEGE